MDIEQMVYNSPERPSTLGDIELRGASVSMLSLGEQEPSTVPENAVVAPAATDASLDDAQAPAAKDGSVDDAKAPAAKDASVDDVL